MSYLILASVKQNRTKIGNVSQRDHFSRKVEFDEHTMKKAQINYETLKRTYYTVWVKNYKTGPTDFEIKHMNLIRMYLMKTLWTRRKSRMDFTLTFEVCT